MEIHKHATQFKIDRKMLLLELAGNMIFRKSVCEPIAAAAAKLDCVFGAIRQRRVAIKTLETHFSAKCKIFEM